MKFVLFISIHLIALTSSFAQTSTSVISANEPTSSTELNLRSVENKNSEPNTFSVYPIPSNTLMNIVLDRPSENTGYVVYDLTGTAVKNGKVNGNTAAVDVSALEDGVYIVQIIDVNGSTSKKVLVSKNN